MILTLEVVGEQAANLGASGRKVFHAVGGTIGRLPDNDWVFPDPYVSGRHALVRYLSGKFFVEDTSTNGVFLNSPDNRLQKSQPHALKDGDLLYIDAYRINVSIESESGVANENVDTLAMIKSRLPSKAPPPAPPPVIQARAPAPIPVPPPVRAAVPPPPPLAPPPRKSVPPSEQTVFLPAEYGQSDDEHTIGMVPSIDDEDEDERDEEDEDLLDEKVYRTEWIGAGKPAIVDDNKTEWIGTSKPAPVDDNKTEWIGTAKPVPVDDNKTEWFARKERQPEPEPPRPRVPPPRVVAPPVAPPAPPKAPPPPVVSAPSIKPQAPTARPVSPPAPPARAPTAPPREVAAERAPARASSAHTTDVSHSDDELMREVLAAAGIVGVEPSMELAQTVGGILRVAVAGLMEVQRARERMKDELRVRGTIFKPAHNNPLKFSANVEDAFHNLLLKHNPAYLDPTHAFEEALHDVRDHHAAVLGALRLAFESMLAQFDPNRMQEDFDRQMKKGSILGVPVKLRYWDLYRDKYGDMVKDADTSFRHLFGDKFAVEYEEQLERLKAQSRERDK